LGEAGAALVRSVYATCEVAASEAVVLRSAAEAADRVAECRRHIATDGVLLTTARGGRYAHPLLKIEKAAAAHLLAALRALGFGGSPRILASHLIRGEKHTHRLGGFVVPRKNEQVRVRVA
jgi:hypothetical protein